MYIYVPSKLCGTVQVTGPVRACGISEDCRHVLALIGNGFIFRWEAQDSADGNPTAMEENPTEEETPMEEDDPAGAGVQGNPEALDEGKP